MGDSYQFWQLIRKSPSPAATGPWETGEIVYRKCEFRGVLQWKGLKHLTTDNSCLPFKVLCSWPLVRAERVWQLLWKMVSSALFLLLILIELQVDCFLLTWCYPSFWTGTEQTSWVALGAGLCMTVQPYWATYLGRFILFLCKAAGYFVFFNIIAEL